MSLVPSITTEAIREIFKVPKTLTEVGFSVVSSTTNGHRTNQSFRNGLGADDEHPEWIINPYSTDDQSIRIVELTTSDVFSPL
ncbi:hypothetical protein FJT64_000432 [Amphibalanus amphitrite]|uniref:Uncharacterized protein n=1 Tax=Amphibalanus amphitrite TaxID=1232801 RepID=A0A6A4W4V4_AMPAM|nr:hypothetical protein FJT64_000432 [Amphibalanus amphitrite]